jgi:hypothetical protein
MDNWSPEDPSGTVPCLAQGVATACRDLMCDLLELKDMQLHCCIKAFPISQENKELVITWARSEGSHCHDDDQSLNGVHRVTNNSVYSALMGKFDGKTEWGRPFSAFCCNDLTTIGPQFICSRNDWEKFYRSTLVFPLRFLIQPSTRKFKTVGFLAFYSKKRNVFLGMPNIFDYSSDWDTYLSKMQEDTVFQVGACMADTISTFLRPVYETDLTTSSEAK